jgi:hypothetical protein
MQFGILSSYWKQVTFSTNFSLIAMSLLILWIIIADKPFTYETRSCGICGEVIGLRKINISHSRQIRKSRSCEYFGMSKDSSLF